MKLGKLVEAQSDQVRAMHAEAVQKHAEGSAAIRSAQELRKRTEIDLAQVQAERTRLEATVRSQERDRDDLSKDRLRLDEEKALAARAAETMRRERMAKMTQAAPVQALPAPVPVAAVGRPVNSFAEQNIKAQLAVWQKERTTAANYLQAAPQSLQ